MLEARDGAVVCAPILRQWYRMVLDRAVLAVLGDAGLDGTSSAMMLD